jgi:hypothetical protein
LRRNSALWRAEGLRIRVRESGQVQARWTAMAAVRVDLPHWRVQLRITRGARRAAISACLGARAVLEEEDGVEGEGDACS